MSPFSLQTPKEDDMSAEQLTKEQIIAQIEGLEEDKVGFTKESQVKKADAKIAALHKQLEALDSDPEEPSLAVDPEVIPTPQEPEAVEEVSYLLFTESFWCEQLNKSIKKGAYRPVNKDEYNVLKGKATKVVTHRMTVVAR